MTWAQRLKRVFHINIETCRARGGAVRIIACIEDPVVIEKILTHLDQKDASAEVSRKSEIRDGAYHSGLEATSKTLLVQQFLSRHDV